MKKNLYIIKKLKKSDYKPWLNLTKKLWSDFSLSDFKRLFNDILKSPRQISFLVYSPEGKAIAFANISLRVDYVEGSHSSPVGYLEGIYVEKEYRHLGIAKRLAEEAEKWAKKKGATEMGSDTWLHSKSSQKFHQKIGFTKAETIVHFIKKIK